LLGCSRTMFQLQNLFFVEDYENEVRRNLVDVYQIFAGAGCSHLQSRKRTEKSRVGEGMRYLFTKLQGVTFQKAVFFIDAVVTNLHLSLFLSMLFTLGTRLHTSTLRCPRSVRNRRVLPIYNFKITYTNYQKVLASVIM